MLRSQSAVITLPEVMTQILTFWVAKYTASLPLFEGSIVPYLAALHEFIGELPVELIEQVRAVQSSGA